MQQVDPETLCAAKAGDEAALATLIARMMPAIRRGAAACITPGLDFDDAVQEGLIGLFGAVRTYEAEKDIPFAAYAAACALNAQRDARRAASRKKHGPLNNSVPLPEDSASPGPEELAVQGERMDEVLHRLQTELSSLEREAMLANLSGESCRETAKRLGRSPKTVENALSRARRKLKPD